MNEPRILPIAKVPAVRSKSRASTSLADGIKSWVGVVQSLLTIMALLVGGWWAWARGSLAESVDVTQEATAVVLNDEFMLIHVDVTIENKGQRSASIEQIRLDVSQVIPLSGNPLERFDEGAEPLSNYWKTGDWPVLKSILHNDSIILMPGEKDRTSFQLCVEKHIEVVDLLVTIPVSERGANQAWSSEKLFEIKSKPNEGSKTLLHSTPSEGPRYYR